MPCPPMPIMGGGPGGAPMLGGMPWPGGPIIEGGGPGGAPMLGGIPWPGGPIMGGGGGGAPIPWPGGPIMGGAICGLICAGGVPMDGGDGGEGGWPGWPLGTLTMDGGAPYVGGIGDAPGGA